MSTDFFPNLKFDPLEIAPEIKELKSKGKHKGRIHFIDYQGPVNEDIHAIAAEKFTQVKKPSLILKNKFFLLHTKSNDGTDVWYKINKNSFVKRLSQTKNKEAIDDLKDKLNQAIETDKVEDFISSTVQKTKKAEAKEFIVKDDKLRIRPGASIAARLAYMTGKHKKDEIQTKGEKKLDLPVVNVESDGSLKVKLSENWKDQLKAFRDILGNKPENITEKVHDKDLKYSFTIPNEQVKKIVQDKLDFDRSVLQEITAVAEQKQNEAKKESKDNQKIVQPPQEEEQKVIQPKPNDNLATNPNVKNEKSEKVPEQQMETPIELDSLAKFQSEKTISALDSIVARLALKFKLKELTDLEVLIKHGKNMNGNFGLPSVQFDKTKGITIEVDTNANVEFRNNLEKLSGRKFQVLSEEYTETFSLTIPKEEAEQFLEKLGDPQNLIFNALYKPQVSIEVDIPVVPEHTEPEVPPTLSELQKQNNYRYDPVQTLALRLGIMLGFMTEEQATSIINASKDVIEVHSGWPEVKAYKTKVNTNVIEITINANYFKDEKLKELEKLTGEKFIRTKGGYAGVDERRLTIPQGKINKFLIDIGDSYILDHLKFD